jgi:ABC-type Fe3+ transport system permease subunit
MESLDKALYDMGPSVLTQPIAGKEERSLVSPVLEGVRLRARRRRLLRIRIQSVGLITMVGVVIAAVFVDGFKAALAQIARNLAEDMAGFRNYVGETIGTSTLLSVTVVVAALALVAWGICTLRGANRPSGRRRHVNRDRSAS